MDNANDEVIGILIKDQSHIWRLVDHVDLKEDEQVFLLETENGRYMIIGDLCEGDLPAIKTILNQSIHKITKGTS